MTRTTISAPRALLGTLALGAAALIGTAAPAAAQGGEPDLGHYCRAQHGHDARAEYRAGQGGWVCVTQRGFERRYRSIDLAAACRLTFGTDGYRPAGSTISCLGSEGDGAGPGFRPHSHHDEGEDYRQVIPNLSGYCRKTYGAGARVAFDRSSGLYVCAAPRAHRRGAAYRRIDMADACFFTVRTTNYRFDGTRGDVRCLVSV